MINSTIKKLLVTNKKQPDKNDRFLNLFWCPNDCMAATSKSIITVIGMEYAVVRIHCDLLFWQYYPLSLSFIRFLPFLHAHHTIKGYLPLTRLLYARTPSLMKSLKN